MTSATATKPRKKSTAGSIEIPATTLARVLKIVEPAVPAKSTKPVLQNVLLADGALTATDLEIRISVPVEAACGPPLLLPFARLKAIASTIHPTVMVTLTPGGAACRIKADGSEWRLPIEDASEFPQAPDDSGASIGRLPGEQLVSLLNAVRFAVDTESSRYALGAVLVEFDRGKASEEESQITFVATDGRRLAAAAARVAAQDLDSSATLVPARAINALVKLGSAVDAVQMSATSREFVAVLGDYEEGQGVTGITLRAMLTEGRFPRWRDVDTTEVTVPAPRRYSERATEVMAGELLHALNQASICTSESSKGVDLTIDADGIQLQSKAAEAGEAAIKCQPVETGHPVKVKLDPRYAAEWLGCGSFDQAETVTIEARDFESAVVLRCGECRTVIMPMAAE